MDTQNTAIEFITEKITYLTKQADLARQQHDDDKYNDVIIQRSKLSAKLAELCAVTEKDEDPTPAPSDMLRVIEEARTRIAANEEDDRAARAVLWYYLSTLSVHGFTKAMIETKSSKPEFSLMCRMAVTRLHLVYAIPNYMHIVEALSIAGYGTVIVDKLLGLDSKYMRAIPMPKLD